MRLISIISLFCIIIFILSGCAMHRAYYDVGLIEVERPVQAKERYGEQKITKTAEAGIDKYYFEDEMVKILWVPTSHQVSFALTNKTDHSIKIIWDEAAFVGVNGISSRVMHSGVKYIDRSNPQPPTVVVRKGTISDLIVPTDNIYYNTYSGWETAPLFPVSATKEEELRLSAQSYVGKTIQVLLPLKIEDVVNEYIFTFKINGFEVN